MYLYLDHHIVQPPRDALESVNVKELWKQPPVVEAAPKFDGSYFRFTATDEERLKTLDLDVLLLFWSGLASPEVSRLARYGVWFFLDHERLFTGLAPPGFWEVLNAQPVMVQCLKARLAESEMAVTLHQHFGPIHARSIRLSRNNMLWKSVQFVSRKLDELHRSGSIDAIAKKKECRADVVIGEGTGSNVTVMKSATAHVSRFVRDRFIGLQYFDQWAIAYKYSSCTDCVDRAFADYTWLIPPKDRFWADPFPVHTKEQDFLFFEECLNSESRGHLCVAAIDKSGLKEDPRVILSRGYHLSYPFVFSWEGERYLIPESREANRIDVYRFDSFPYNVSYYKTIMDNVDAVDATLFERDGRWWMFVGIAQPGTQNVDELFLFSADNPFGPWVSHPKNPIKSDVRAARPAGMVSMRQGKYYRPAQDCSQSYGYAIRLQEIKVLSETDYAEEEVMTICPDWSSDLLGTHTLNAAGSLSVIDALKRRRR